MAKPIFYFTEDPDHGIGNLINITPAMKLYADWSGEPAKLFAISDIPKQLFRFCKFIEIIRISVKNWEIATGRKHKRLMGSNFKNYEVPDWKLACDYVVKKFGMDVEPEDYPHTYVYPPLSVGADVLLQMPYVAIAKGGISFISEKDPGPEIYIQIISDIAERGHNIIFVGHRSEMDLFEQLSEKMDPEQFYFVADDLERVKSVIDNASLFINCDSGLTHIAGALNTPSFILWKDTWFEKNRTPSNVMTYSHKGNWFEDWEKIKSEKL
jgi:ADP-heptose:LPS heptosyltransferase